MAAIFDDALSSLREYYTLARAEERARSMSEERRAQIASAVQLASQRRVAAETLMRSGAPAEGLRLIREALGGLLEHRELVSLSREVSSELPPLPVLDEDCKDEHLALYEQLLAAESELETELRSASLEGSARTARRVGRRVTTATVVLVGLVGLVLTFGRTRLAAEASGEWSTQYPASNAVDGNETTHWVMPDRSVGWLDVKLLPARKLTTVSVLTGYQPPTYGVVDYRLEAYAGDKVVHAVDGKFDVATGGVKPPWVTIAIPTDQKVDKVRLNVKSYHDIGGSIAEVKIP